MVAFTGEFDAVLHLLDRQIVDVDGYMVGKVDDLELRESDGELLITGILLGAPVFVDRLGGRLAEHTSTLWRRTHVRERDGDVPHLLDLAWVERLDSAVHLNHPREHLLPRQADEPDGPRHKFQDLMWMRARGGTGENLGSVLDVRVTPRRNTALVITSLIIGRGRPGSMLGYDRSPDQGPWLLNRIVRRLHRHSRQVPFPRVGIDWERGTIVCNASDLEELRPRRSAGRVSP